MTGKEFQRIKASYESALRDLENATRAHEMMGSARTAQALQAAGKVKEAAEASYHEAQAALQNQSEHWCNAR